MLSYLPTSHELFGVAGLAATLVLFLALGSAVTSRRTLPEVRLVAGWGLACLALTAWGALTPWPLRVPAAALAVGATGWLARPGCRERIAAWGGLGRILLLASPLWLVMLSAWPSQIDTWLNLLPNAAYLFDHDLLPAASRPPSFSFLPVAPYHTQFAAYLASLASGSFAESAMGLFNVALLCCAGLLLARAVAGAEGTPPWWACAAGLLLTSPFNPGFVPRFFLSPYGEPSLAVTALLGVWLAAQLLSELASGSRWPRSLAPLALVLAALVNIKQSGIGLLLPIGVSALVLALTDPQIPYRRALTAIGAALAPALLLYLLWRAFVLHSGFVAGELQPLPFADWNWAVLPEIVVAMLIAAFRKATFFLCVAGVLILAVLHQNRRSFEGRLLMLIACVVVLFNGFLLFTYVAHFPKEIALGAHSFFRYNTQVSLLVMLGLVVGLRPWIAGWLTAHNRPKPAARAAVTLVLLLPIATAPLLRFDRETPQPELWDLAHNAAAYLRPGDRLALVLPNDTDDSVGSYLRGVLMFTPPRRPGLHIRTETDAATDALPSAAAAGYELALVTCMPDGTASMLRHAPEGWQRLQTWSWPTSLKAEPFGSMLARGPLCAGPRPK